MPVKTVDAELIVAPNALSLGQCFTPTKVGMVIEGEPTVDEWLSVGEAMKQINGSVQWLIGDWLNYGEGKYGEMYSQALEATEYDYQTLNRSKQVSSKIEIKRRRLNLSFAHHQEVAPLAPDDQEYWLDKAESEGLSKSQLRASIQSKKKHIDDTSKGEYIEPVVTLKSWEQWLPDQDDCDLLLTDPPYSTDIDDIRGFASEWLPVALSKVKPTGRAYVCIGAYPDEISAYLAADHAGMKLCNILVWTYRNTLGPTPKYDYKLNWQAILYFRGPQSPALDCPVMNEQFAVQDISAPDGRHGNRFHEWQKPDELAERLIRHSTTPGDLVLDPFVCTGTFLLAAARLGRQGRGCDISHDNLTIAQERGCNYET